jgi:dTDP-4-dehydrorhamnose reductase
MKYPKILLTGGTGQVGYELQTTLKPLGNVWAPNRQEFDLSDPESLRAKIQAYQPNLIVNPAAYTAVDQAESEPELAHIINAEAPRVMAEEANKLGVPLIHYSTDYVFDGEKTEPYTEEDEPNPLNVYGRTKLEGERAIQQAHDQYLILRTSWVYSPTRGKNFYRTMLRLFQEKEEIRVVDDQIGAPTSAQFLADRTAEILSQLKTKEQGEDRWGLYNLAASGKTSWFEFSKEIYGLLIAQNPGCLRIQKIIRIPSSEYLGLARRPPMSLLCSQKIQAFHIRAADWLDELCVINSLR